MSATWYRLSFYEGWPGSFSILALITHADGESTYNMEMAEMFIYGVVISSIVIYITKKYLLNK
jgi:hypothetical protein